MAIGHESLQGRRATGSKPDTWHHVVVTYDGSRQPVGHCRSSSTASPCHVEGRSIDQETLKGDVRTYAPLQVGATAGNKYFDGGAIADLRIYHARADRRGSADRRARGRVHRGRAASKPTRDAVRRREERASRLVPASASTATIRGLLDEDRTLQDEREAIATRGTVTHVKQERTDRKPFANILYRGEYDQPREKVEPAVPSALPPMPAILPAQPPRLAKWLVDGASADRPRDGQPLLAGGLRHRPRADSRRLRRRRASCRRIPSCSTGWPSSSAKRAGT